MRKLILTNCKEDDNGKYRFEADGRKTEAILIVEGNYFYNNNNNNVEHIQ